MFTLTVRDHMMIAHSLPDPYFGPAQGLHGATYVVELTVSSEVLNEHAVVMDIGVAGAHLASVMADLSYRNLDEHPAFASTLSTTEVLARHVAEQIAAALRSGPPEQTSAIRRIGVVLRENPDAWAGYTLDLPEPRDA